MLPELQVSLCTFLLVYVRMIIGLQRCKGSCLFKVICIIYLAFRGPLVPISKVILIRPSHSMVILRAVWHDVATGYALCDTPFMTYINC
jgi:hypothetical protein